MKTYRIGVVGAGSIAQQAHIPAYAAAAQCELSAVVDPDPERLKELREKGWSFGAEYGDYREMFAHSALDAVSVCTPNKFHAEVAIAALEAGCDVLLEKPVAMNMTEALAIQSAVKRTGRRLMVGFTHRFNELNRAAKAAVSAGKIGRPYMIRIRFAHKGPIPGWAKSDWFYDPVRAGGGAGLDMGVHAFDLLQWYQGPVQSVSAKVATLRKKIAVDDNIVAWVDFGMGCLGYVECGWTSPAGFVGVEIMGDEGCVIVDYASSTATMRSGSMTPDGKIELVEAVLAKGYTKEPWPTEVAHFISGLGGAEAYTPGIDDGVATQRLVLAAYESSRTGRHVEVASIR